MILGWAKILIPSSVRENSIAILQSRPEERRALIEEAAGISKHKRRKERALKKIASMDEHLKRARDINREITRQLRPLERQVDRACKYRDLTNSSQRAYADSCC